MASVSPTLRAKPVGDDLHDLVRRIFLEVMGPRDRHLGLRWQSRGEVEIAAAAAAMISTQPARALRSRTAHLGQPDHGTSMHSIRDATCCTPYPPNARDGIG